MNKLKTFCKYFTDKEIPDVVKIGRRYYQAEASLVSAKDKITSRDTFSIGLPLGEEKKGFQPSLALLDILAKTSDKKAFIAKKASWLFLCKRDVFEDSILQSKVKTGLVLVQNERDENLGLGELKEHRGKKLLRAVLDRGDFLRREK